MKDDPLMPARLAGAGKLAALVRRMMGEASVLMRAARCLADPAMPMREGIGRLRRYTAGEHDNAAKVLAILEEIEAEDPALARRSRNRARARRQSVIQDLRRRMGAPLNDGDPFAGSV
jgi:hypothetical protein